MKRLQNIILISLFVAAMLLFGGCSKERLSSPSNISIDDDLNLTWNSVENARSYTVDITNIDDGVSTQNVTRRNKYSLMSLAEGDYEIKIMATGYENRYENSQWSITTEFRKYKENGCIYKLINAQTEYKLVHGGSASGSFIIEDSFRGKPVTMIDTGAFRASNNIESVTIEGNTITEIADYAFYNCSKLTTVTLSDSVKKIGERAFQSCRQLTQINLPTDLKEIEPFTFAYCTELKSITFGEKITFIGESAFVSCSSLTEVVIPNSVTEIGPYAFSGCSKLIQDDDGETENYRGLKTVKIGKYIKAIDEYAFADNAVLESVTFTEDCVLESIDRYAFSNCTSLTNPVLPANLTTIGRGAFSSCSAITDIKIPTTVTSVGMDAFYNTAFYVKGFNEQKTFIYADNWLVAITDKALELQRINAGNKDSEIKTSTVGIADGVFKAQSVNVHPKVEYLSLPSNVKYIGELAFFGCTELTRIYSTSSSKLISIGEQAFNGCTKLFDMMLPSSLQTIGAYAFYKCSSLDNNSNLSIIPSGVKSIGMNAFKEAKLWNNVDEDGLIYAGNWVVGSSENAKAQISLPNNVVGIADYAFYGANKVQRVSMASVRYLGTGAFYKCEKLSSVVFGSNLQTISDYAFYKCDSLTAVTFPVRLREIGRSAFYKCSFLYSLDFSNTSLKSIGENAFYNCASLTELTLNEGLENIGNKAFYSAISLKSLKIPYTVEEIGEKAFYGASAMTTLDFLKNSKGETSITEIKESTFNKCSSLNYISIPDSVITINDKAFYGCENAAGVIIGNNVTEIGDYAFFKLNSVNSLILPKSLTKVGKFAFSYFKLKVDDIQPEDSSSEATSEENSDSSAVEEEPVDEYVSPVKCINVYKTIENIGAHAFYGYAGATVYTDAIEDEVIWNRFWNSSFRPVIWGCVFAEDGNYVTSVTVTDDTVSNENAKNGISAPERTGYKFLGWTKTLGSDTVDYTASEIVDVPVGTTLYAIWGV